jgi:hypothetical protein
MRLDPAGQIVGDFVVVRADASNTCPSRPLRSLALALLALARRELAAAVPLVADAPPPGRTGPPAAAG